MVGIIKVPQSEFSGIINLQGTTSLSKMKVPLAIGGIGVLGGIIGYAAKHTVVATLTGAGIGIAAPLVIGFGYLMIHGVST